LLGNSIHMFAAKLTEQGCRPIIFKRDTAIFILAQKDANGRIQSCR